VEDSDDYQCGTWTTARRVAQQKIQHIARAATLVAPT